LDEIKRIKDLLDFCDAKKVQYREAGNQTAEELYAYLAFKVGMMYEMTVLYAIDSTLFESVLTARYHGSDANATEMKIYEVQNLILPHFISIIESSLRQMISKKKANTPMMILNDILLWLHKKRIITDEQLHLWTGIRQIRNAVVHYNRRSMVTDTYHFSDELIFDLKKGESFATTDLFQDFKLMEWMAYHVEPIVSQRF